MNDADRLLASLQQRAQKRRRLSIDTVWAVFRSSIRGYTGAAEARPHLATLLDELDDAGHVALPRSDKRWDRSARPALPMWVQVGARVRAKPSGRDHRAIAWPPELAFVASLPQVAALDELLAIKRFLAEGGRKRRLIPVRERSLELFAAEKRLDSLTKSELFRGGRLSFELLRCYEVAPPLVWERSPNARPQSPVIILENLHSYESFRRWNRRAGAYLAVAYGHGSEFKATCRDLPRLRKELGASSVHYFGDLDFQGLSIPVHARRVLRELSDPIELEPATRWYRALLARVDEALPCDTTPSITTELLSWLASEQRVAARSLLEASKRLPQEFIGTDVLEELEE